MRRLILFRHAKTEARPAGSDDFDRRLTDRGRDDAALMGRVLAEAGIAPDLVLVSPAARARETWELAGPAFPFARVEFRRGLYEASAEEAADEIALGTRSADTVMVVGHNPSLQELGVGVLEDAGAADGDIERLSRGFPTSAAAVFSLDAGPRLEALFHARDYRGCEA
jgi:phosphohistidine phosphatase